LGAYRAEDQTILVVDFPAGGRQYRKPNPSWAAARETWLHGARGPREGALRFDTHGCSDAQHGRLQSHGSHSSKGKVDWSTHSDPGNDRSRSEGRSGTLCLRRYGRICVEANRTSELFSTIEKLLAGGSSNPASDSTHVSDAVVGQTERFVQQCIYTGLMLVKLRESILSFRRCKHRDMELQLGYYCGPSRGRWANFAKRRYWP
jgi:hypothetical protein